MVTLSEIYFEYSNRSVYSDTAIAIKHAAKVIALMKADIFSWVYKNAGIIISGRKE